MNRGEVWWVEPPNAVRRPYLVLTRETAIPILHSVIAVPATRTIRNIITEVALDQSDGMPDECVLTFDNLTVVDKADFVAPITRLSESRMTEVCRALRVATGC